MNLDTRQHNQGTSSAVLLKRNSFFRSVLAVLWSFLGVRKASEFQEDVQKISPLHVIFVGLIFGFLFVIGLIVVVKLVVSN